MVGAGVGVSVGGNQTVVDVGTTVDVDVAVGKGVRVAVGKQALRERSTISENVKKKIREFILYFREKSLW